MISLLNKIIKSKSITPNDKNCQRILKKFFKNIGFQVFSFKKNNIKNSIFIRFPKKKIKYLLSGHSDVVSANKMENWMFYPFYLGFKNKYLYSRGIVDMKAALICFCYSVKFALKTNNDTNIAVIITSNEEGNSKFGTLELVKLIKRKNIKIENTIIGEPTSNKKLFDCIKNGRRGSANFQIEIKGKQGHSAYPKNTINPIKKLVKLYKYISKINTKKNNIQITTIKTINKSLNIIPGEIIININIRYTNKNKLLFLIRKIGEKLNKRKNKLKKINNSKPYYKKSKKLIKKIIKIIKIKKKNIKITKTIGGTSDGRFIQKITKNIIEIGLLNKTAHKYNERTHIKHLFKLMIFYRKLILI
ncbi:MAG: succinyl-diaminopimelate desuccinylase [Candidatus Vidania fulgoroideorum]